LTRPVGTFLRWHDHLAAASGIVRSPVSPGAGSCWIRLTTDDDRAHLRMRFASGRGSLYVVSVRLHLASVPADAERSDQASPPIRVVLADDHTLVRRSLRLLLEEEDGVDVVGEAVDVSSVTRLVHGDTPHVLVLDLQMPGTSSIETIRRLRDQVPDTDIVVVTMEPSPTFVQRAIDAGAIGVVLKDRADDELPIAVRRAAQGEEYVSSRIAAALQGLRRAINGDGLSPRETEVLRLIALGHTSAEIARSLHVSVRTIDSHRASIHRKLGLRTRADLVHLALRRGLVRN
jgi:two-component system, NarL family, response regulator NreC